MEKNRVVKKETTRMPTITGAACMIETAEAAPLPVSFPKTIGENPNFAKPPNEFPPPSPFSRVRSLEIQLRNQ